MKVESTKEGVKFIPESDMDCYMMGRLEPILSSYNLSTDRDGEKWNIKSMFIKNDELVRLLFVELPHEVKEVH